MQGVSPDALAWAERQADQESGPYLTTGQERAFRRRILADPDAATGCADDQVFAAVPVDLLRRIADA